uniref:Uncharacterized protein n=1 Tax=uncultured marine proteobacterium TaxID=482892 RepID=Q8RTX9_9PROT|nr:hypothetical protein MBMO_EBAC000-65D09.2 [uncultured marine proteobacterium]
MQNRRAHNSPANPIIRRLAPGLLRTVDRAIFDVSNPKTIDILTQPRTLLLGSH